MTTFYHDAIPPTKICNTCHVEKPLDEFHHRKKSKDGHKSDCKDCRKIEGQQRWRKKQPIPRHLPPASNGMKICRTCLEEKPLDQFYPDKRSSDGLGTECKACMHYRYYVLNAEQTHERTRRNWEISGEKYKVAHKKWLELNKFAVREMMRRRECKMRDVTIADVDYAYILERDGMWCHICEQVILPHQSIEFDHVIPISRDGAHSEENIKVAHKGCNRRKKDKLMEELTPYHRRGPKV